MRLSCLDAQQIQATNEVIYDDAKRQGLLEAYKYQTFSEAAKEIVREMFEQDVPVLEGDLLAIYCVILKSIEVGLTHKLN